MSAFHADRETLLSAVRGIPASGPAPALVFNAHITGLAVVRSLGRRGVPVIALDPDPRGFALRSRYATVAGRVPYVLDDDAGFVTRLLEIGEALGRPAVLFPGNDEWTLGVARHRRELERHFRIPFAEEPTLDALLDKRRLYRIARDLGIPIPRTWFPDEMPLERIAEEIPYPAILKPAFQREFTYEFGVKVFEARDRAEFLEMAARAERFGPVAQEMVPTDGDSFYSLASYLAPGGEAQGLFVGRKLEQFPVGFGTGCLCDARWLPELAERGTEVLRAFGYHGISEVEFLRDPRDGEFKLLDANTRTWKWIGLPVAAGVDLPWMAYSAATGKAVEPVLDPSSSDGLRWLFARDYVALKKGEAEGGPVGLTPGDHLSDAEWKSLFEGEGRVVEAVHAPDDPEPSVGLVRGLFEHKQYFCAC